MWNYLILTWSRNCVITNSTGKGKFAITDTKLYVPVVTFSTQDNTKLLQQLKSGLEQLTGTNTNQIQKHMYKTDIYYLLKIRMIENRIQLSSKSRSKRVQCQNF